ncbi:MAG: hypothetical protein QXP44_02675, partial [Candidatus Bathyarchaeia archaeon]
ATDAFGNTAASETVHFTVANPAKAAILQTLAITLPMVAIVALVIVIRCKRRKQCGSLSSEKGE